MPRPKTTDRRDGTPDNLRPPAVPENTVPTTIPTDDAPNIPVKRPRGRPPKKSAPSVMDQIEAIIRKAEEQPGPAPVKRPRGRPRKNPLPEAVLPNDRPFVKPASEAFVPSQVSPEASPPVQTTASPAAGTGQQAPQSAPSSARPARRPHPDGPPPEAFPRQRGRRPKDRIPPFTIAPGNQSPFCPKCGTYIRLFKPKRGRWRRVCPRCQPERLIEKRDPRFNLDKTGMPCKDRGKCRPERCVKALECTEMARKGGIRGSSRKKAG
jgi:hypothetical protein